MYVTKERWRELCKQASIEKDPGKLVKLYDEINAILHRASNANPQANPAEKQAGPGATRA